jgi:hypothetical protein
MRNVGQRIDIVELPRIPESLRSSADDCLETTFTEAKRPGRGARGADRILQGADWRRKRRW